MRQSYYQNLIKLKYSGAAALLSYAYGSKLALKNACLWYFNFAITMGSAGGKFFSFLTAYLFILLIYIVWIILYISVHDSYWSREL